jgi:hypothetical protein
MEHRARMLGVDTLRPWDTLVELESREPLRPFTTGEELVAPALRVFDALDPQLGAWFRDMAENDSLDLSSRPGKAPGGVQTLGAAGPSFHECRGCVMASTRWCTGGTLLPRFYHTPMALIAAVDRS